MWFIEAQFEPAQEQLFINVWRKQRYTTRRNAQFRALSTLAHAAGQAEARRWQNTKDWLSATWAGSRRWLWAAPLCASPVAAAWHQIIQSGLHAELLVFVIKISSQWLRGLFSGSAPESLFIWAGGVCGYLTPNQCCIRQPFYGYTSRRILSKGMMFSPSSSIQMEFQP